MIDNYDSFTYNIVQYLGELGGHVKVIYNDEMSIPEIKALNPDKIVISPGPCTPVQAGISLEIIQCLSNFYPILGVCLGHQSIVHAFGGKIVHAKKIMHGKTSFIYHRHQGVFSNLPSPFIATRYHSLVACQSTLPSCLEITAWTQNEDGSIDEIMGIKHHSLPLEGVQFHPESILTQYGHRLLANFLKYTTC